MNNVGRNDPCPCGSNKKYKKCCLLKLDQIKQDEQALRQQRQALYDSEWDFWWQRDQEIGRKNMAEATINPDLSFESVSHLVTFSSNDDGTFIE